MDEPAADQASLPVSERLSPLTRMVMAKIAPFADAARLESGVPAELAERCGLTFQHGHWNASGLLLASPGLSSATLEARGLEIRSQAGDVWSFALPIDQLPVLTQIESANYIALTRRAAPDLDEATRETRVDAAQAGQGLESPVSGKGVIVGVIDLGFDPTHPAFRSPDGSRRRIQRVWYQRRENGNAPAGYSHGAEYVGDEVETAGADLDRSSHATHVTGIAAGSSYRAPGGKHTGVAPEADIIYSHYGNIETGILDAASYMTGYASASNQPLIANMSLGTHIGPHDGTTLLDRGLANLSGPGVIFTGSAGNSGDIPLHIRRVFGRNDTIATLVGVYGTSETNASFSGEATLDIWADGPFAVKLTEISGFSGRALRETNFVSSSEGQASGGLQNASYSMFTEESNPLNGKHHILIEIENESQSVVGLTIVADEGVTLDAWNAGTLQGGPFLDRYFGLESVLEPHLVESGYSSTVGEIAGSGEAVITVGAYTTTNEYRDVDNDFTLIGNWAELGEIAPFSSKGPTADGRVKPEIAAPGNVVIAPGSSYDRNRTQYYNNYQLIDVIEGEREWLYLAFEGTSMSAPIAAGVIALMLEVNPNLTHQQVREILTRTARQDGFTGSIGAAGDQTWGWGKIDALAAVRETAETVSIDELETPWAGALTVWPNPAADALTLAFLAPTHTRAELEMTDMAGRAVLARTIDPTAAETLQLDLSELPAGTYALRVVQGGKVDVKKVVIAR